MFKCLKGDFGTPFIIDYCMLETFTLLQQRGLSHVIESLLAFVRTNKIRIYFISEQTFDRAAELMVEKTKQGLLSLADCSQIEVRMELRLDTIATFDTRLANFFKNVVGEGCFDQLDEKEKRLLLKVRTSIAQENH